jgi:outer membrane receptor for ferrienterochelin and colicins
VALNLRFSTSVLVAIFGLFVLAGALARAQSSDGTQPLPPGSAAGQADSDMPDSDQAKSADDIDKLLEMADKNVEGLTKVSVATATDPIVEGVSKKDEKLSESPGIVDVITAKDIEDFGAKNLYEILQRATSVYMTGSFLFPRNVASIRGDLIKHEDNQVLVLINGRPFRDSTLGGVNFSIYTAFPIQTIERVEIIRGPGSVLYGTNALTGVINVVTKDPDKPTMTASVLSGSHGWQSYSVAGGDGNKDAGAYAGSTYSREKGWPFTATSEPGFGGSPATTETAPWGEDNVGVFAMYRSGGFAANLFVARASEETLGPIVQWFGSGELKDPRVFCDLGYLLKLDDCQSIQTNFTYNYDGTRFPGIPDPTLTTIATAHSFLFEATYRAELTPDLSFIVGALSDTHVGGTATGSLDALPPFTETWYGVYAQLEYQATEWLKLVGGIQGNIPGVIQGGIVPRAGVIATLDPHWTAKFLYGQSFRSPYQTERSIDVPGILIGNPDLSPETMQTFDAQLSYHTEEFRLALTGFHSDFRDIVTRVGVPQTYENLGAMKFDGVELENDWKLSECWRCLGSMTYQTNERDGVSNTTNVPNWMLKGGIDYHTYDGWNVGLFDVYYSRPAVNPTALDVNPDPQAYHLVSLNTTLDLDRRLHWRVGHSLRLQFLVQNLLNEPINQVEFEREVINTLPAGPGRTYYGGLTMEY